MKTKSTRNPGGWQLPAASALLHSPPVAMGVQPKRSHLSTVQLIMMILMVMALWISGVNRANAVIISNPATQFDVTGYLQEATLDLPVPGTGTAHQGGHLKVNGHTVTVPAETIVILPANALTWEELFSQAPAPYTGVATGMALNDSPAPLANYEVQVIGNRVCTGGANSADPCNGATSDTYIAGLIYISQQALNSGSGFINFINYNLGEMRVGGTIKWDANTSAYVLDANNPGTRVRLNDPANPTSGNGGRYGRAMSPDIRFMVDQDNPTIASETGFPMCLPRVAPTSTTDNTSDPLCPQTQRFVTSAAGAPVEWATSFTMNLTGSATLDPSIQAPFEVGDYVDFAGTLVSDNDAQPTAMPVGGWPGTANTYVSAHTINNNVAIYTQRGTNPAYVRTDVTLIGTGGNIVLGAGEAVIRTRFEGMSTDPGRNIHLYGIDLSSSGATTDRDYGLIGVDQGPPNGALMGRWRFRPPCAKFGSSVTDKQCVMNSAGTFLPVTREVRAVIDASNGFPAAFTAPITGASPTAANGIVYGQYHAPIGEYIFPENIPGAPIVANNFNTIPFLTLGGYSSSTGTLVGQLDPWPGPPVIKTATDCGVLNNSLTVTSALYRTSKQRLVITATANGSPVLTLRPYKTSTGQTYDPANIGNEFTCAGGICTLDIAGVPQPNTGSSSGFTPNVNGVQAQGTTPPSTNLGCSSPFPITVRTN